MTGSIKNLVIERGFGFIVEDSTRTEYFFHRSALKNGVRIEGLAKGQRVEFKAEMPTGKGPRAEEITLV